jgi:hypothetical protein
MLAAKGVNACNPVFPVTVIVWDGPLWFGGCQIEALVHVFGEIDVCLCESEIGLSSSSDLYRDDNLEAWRA